MAKQLQLSIPEPCHEGWEKMTPVEKGRFCDSCQKQVVDFSMMSDRQMAEFFKKPSTGSVCGRFMTDQLDRNIAIPRKRIPWIKYFFQFVIPAFLLSIKASAQQIPGRKKSKTVTKMPPGWDNRVTMGLVGPSICYAPPKKTTAIVDTTPAQKGLSFDERVSLHKPDLIIKGVVMNDKYEPLEGATIMVRGAGTGTVSDQQGQFKLRIKAALSNPVIDVTYIGYERKEIQDISLSTDSLVIKLDRRGEDNFTLGVVVIAPVTRKELKDVPLMPATTDMSISNFRVFPNPVASGGYVTMESRKLKEGAYTLLLLDQSGQTVHQQETRVEERTELLTIKLPQLIAGTYFLVLANKKTGKKFTEKLIIQ